jgi:hypothetical protein
VTVPVPLFLVVALGLVPAAVIVLLTLEGLVDAFHGVGGGAIWVFVLVQVAILGVILYLAARGLARILCAALPTAYAVLSCTVLIGSLIVASCFEIYLLPDHHGMPTANLVGVARYFAVHWSASLFRVFFPDL